MTLKVLRLPDVIDRVGLGSSFIYLLIQRKEFPKPMRLGKRAVGWPEAEVNAWLEERLADRGELY